MCRRECDLKVAEMGRTALPLGSRQDLKPADESSRQSRLPWLAGWFRLLCSLACQARAEGNEQARLPAPALLAPKSTGSPPAIFPVCPEEEPTSSIISAWSPRA